MDNIKKSKKSKGKKSINKRKIKKGGTPWLNHNVENNNENIISSEDLNDPHAILPCGHIFNLGTIKEIYKYKPECPICRGTIDGFFPAEKKNGKWKLKPFNPIIAEFTGEIYTHRFSSTSPFINKLISKYRTTFNIEEVLENGIIYYKISWKKKGNDFSCYFDYIDDLRSRNIKYISFINLGKNQKAPKCEGFRGRNENVGIRIKPDKEYEPIINRLKKIINLRSYR